MNKEIDESPYCEVCGTCGCIGCCGIRNFISKHIEGKTNCKNESWVIQDLVNLCDYKDEVFKQNEKYKEALEEADDAVEYWQIECDKRSKVLDKIKEYIENTDDFDIEIFDENSGGCLGTDLSKGAKHILELLEEIE